MILHPAINMEQTEDNDFLVTNVETNETYKIGFVEGLFLCNYNPNIETMNIIDWDEETIRQAETFFFKAGLLVDESQPIIIKKRFDITRIKIWEFEVDSFLNRTHKVVMFLTGKSCITFYFVMMLLGAILSIINSELIFNRLDGIVAIEQGGQFNITGVDFILMYILLIIAVFIHELSHILMCKRICGKVGKVGVLLYFLQPALFCDLTSLYKINRKKEKIKALFSGIYIQWFLSGIAMVNYVLLNKAFNIDLEFLLLFSIANAGISFYNLIPFTKLDGYWILSSILNIDNLYQKSLAFLLNKVKNIGNVDISNERTCILLAYGTTAAMFYVLFWGFSLTQVYKVIVWVATPAIGVGLVSAIVSTILYQLFIRVKNIGISKSQYFN